MLLQMLHLLANLQLTVEFVWNLVPAWPVWRDPVHDFGILRFDKSKVRFMDLVEVPLSPEEARVGLAVKVSGSDAGEKLAVLSGIIARIDRPAANTSGGSSGSPVINIDGRAVALNAGGSTQAASSFFLPLERVKRALDLIRQGKKVPRGTLQVEFSQKQYDECRRLGLPMEMESDFRSKSPDLNGILAVKNILPRGQAHNKLLVGDLIIKINGNLVNHFVELAEILDSHSPEANPETSNIVMTVFRDRKMIDVEVTVGSLHSVSPSRYVEIGGSIVHELSYQMARSYLHYCGGIFVADTGHMLGVAGLPSQAFITSVAHKRVQNLDDFIAVMSSVPIGKKIPLRYYTLTKKKVEIVKIIVVESLWGRFRLATRDDDTGLWTYTNLQYSSEKLKALPSDASFLKIPNRNTYSELGNKVMPSLCLVEYHSPFGIDGANVKWADGVGILYDSSVGLVLVDRATIPTVLGTLILTFANNIIVPGRIVYVHPMWNFAFIQYDVSFFRSVSGKENGILPVQSIELSSKPGLQAGDECFLVTINAITHIPRVHATSVKGRGYFLFADSKAPKFRTMNWDDAITLNKGPGGESGVITDESGRVRAAWLINPSDSGNSFLGLSLEKGSQVRRIGDYLVNIFTEKKKIQSVLEGAPSPFDFELNEKEAIGCKLRLVDVELSETYLWKARELGLSEHWINTIKSSRAKFLEDLEARGQISQNEESKPLDVFEVQDLDKREHSNAVAEDSSSEMKSDDSLSYQFHSDSGDKYTILTVRRTTATQHGDTEDIDSDDDFTEEGDDTVYEKRGGFKEGDLLLSIDGVPVTHMSQFFELELKQPRLRLPSESASNSGTTSTSGEKEIVLLRNSRYLKLRVPTIVLSGEPSVDVVHWGGAVIQNPHRALWFFCKHLPAGVYVSLLYTGSPAQRDGVSACWFIVEVDGKKTPTLEAFLEAVEGPDWQSNVPVVNPLSQDGWDDLSAKEKEQIEVSRNAIGRGESRRRSRRSSVISVLVGSRRDSIDVSDQILDEADVKLERPDGVDPNELFDILEHNPAIMELAQEPEEVVEKAEDQNVAGELHKPVQEGDPEEVGAAAANELGGDEDVLVNAENMIENMDDEEDEFVSDEEREFDEDVNKATITKSFSVRLMSGEQVSKVVTVDICMASKNYFPTWRCKV
ncbi:hypothetical protein HK098_003978 [Nowakowskiella sp. JEL0407]|nr:hypothetical protein HK098_003978 [Nowakowskiella sp. JEL0407]